ncbi:Ldh family oxidoreductase [candidate division WWE3 bacterium]|nr:Ldh family oxidoreductase [candidate division WWE3 bacterium]
MKIKITQLESLVKKALKKYGYTPKEIKIIKDVLLYAQLRGNNQGIVKLIGKGIPRRSEGKPPFIVKQTKVSALVDGNCTHAMVVMDFITNLAIKKAKKIGIGISGNFNTSESTGALGYYVNKIAQNGFIGIAFSSSPFQTTAPYGSNEAKFCTNPMAYGIPTDTDPILLDMTTSTMAYYGLIEAKTAEKKLPDGVGYDSQGNPTTNPAEIMSGALKTMGGHKGSGLALVVQILAGAFVSAESFNDDSVNAGNLVIAIDPKIFGDLDEFKHKVSGIVSKIKLARKIEGVTEIQVPGEGGNNKTKKAYESGEIEVEDNLLNELKKVVKG